MRTSIRLLTDLMCYLFFLVNRSTLWSVTSTPRASFASRQRFFCKFPTGPRKIERSFTTSWTERSKIQILFTLLSPLT